MEASGRKPRAAPAQVRGIDKGTLGWNYVKVGVHCPVSTRVGRRTLPQQGSTMVFGSLST
jgi:hypothetical protein